MKKALSRGVGRFAGMAVGHQLYAAFALVLTLTAVVGVVALGGLARVDAQANLLADKWLQGLGQVAAARVALLEARDNEVKHSRTSDKSYHSEYAEKVTEASKLV
jgi:hypothetical protein